MDNVITFNIYLKMSLFASGFCFARRRATSLGRVDKCAADEQNAFCVPAVAPAGAMTLTLASTCLTPASFSSEPSYFYAFISWDRLVHWWKFFNAEFGTDAFLFLEIHVLILSGYFHSNETQHITWSNNQELQVAGVHPYFNGMRALDTRKDWTKVNLKIQRTSQGYSNLLPLSPYSFVRPVMASPRKQVQILIFLIKSLMAVRLMHTSSGILGGWHSSPLTSIFFFPLQDGYCSEPTSLFQKKWTFNRRVFGNCLGICPGARWFAAVNQCS